ncbi:unnamed protein product [Didymodactylos carnosus]|uniref:Uncharacterized protein n=1 Tax=Didymodactylos carnosus TaxID=1234261 RepID=A0A815AE01_9BILA|nr:unnamed protein product [Didymodactylos carnosus]CAF4033146.1 unnamed protein product [Didymodactylos carnosus]
MPVRFLTCTVGEAYEKFRQDYPGFEIRRSKFNSLRPKYAKKTSTHEVCVCIYHENISLLMERWSRVSNEKMSNLLALVLCNANDLASVSRSCKKCGDILASEKLLSKFNGTVDDPCDYMKWEQEEKNDRSINNTSSGISRIKSRGASGTSCRNQSASMLWFIFGAAPPIEFFGDPPFLRS